ncbi:MAG: DUF4395 domain-containing protein [Acidimicrobiia bacterium]|nr:DUF4395 domain-containing protein [Acidimicrobiia bacterium]
MISQTVDVNVPRFNQAVVAVVTAVAFVFQMPALVGLMFVVLAISRLGGPRWAPLTRFYVTVVRPRIQPAGPREFEAAAPPRFAQLLGALFLGGGYACLLAGWSAVGWVLTLTVTALASLAASARICVGCLIYERAVVR